MKNKPNGLFIIIAVVFLMAYITHCEELNGIKGINVTHSEVSVDVGDFHYRR